jgi:L-glyceraldehyde 3-phosphate reductase
MAWQPAEDRYSKMKYNRCGRSGLQLPAISLGLWHNFGEDTSHERKVAICRKAFDLGITHFDLANNYGPKPGSAEAAFGQILREDFKGHRDELIISSKAGYNMWPGPYGEWGSRKYLIASCDQSLKRMGLDYVDIFYSHRFDPDTPLEETCGALDHIVRSGRALYVGISSYNSRRTREAAAILKALGTPVLIHQPSYSMINRWVEEDGLLDALDELGIGSIVFSPLAQGMLTSKYLGGIPDDSRAAQGKSLRSEFLNEKNVANLRALNAIAEKRGQTLAQMALAWVLRGGRVTTALIGASRPEQVEDCVKSLERPDFTPEELAEIDVHAKEADINLWAASAERQGPSRNK